MKNIFICLCTVLFLSVTDSSAQQVHTLFNSSGPSGGYGAISNKFTSIRGEYANLAEVYGGWFAHKRFLIGLGAAASTNDIRVPAQFSTSPLRQLSWQYGQFGLMTEYVFGSSKVIHVNFTLFGGGGFTVQYQRPDYDDWDDDDFDYDSDDFDHDENFFYVVEPGVQVELNVLKWMRLSPGVSYRQTFGSDGIGLRDDDLSDWSYNVTLKFGKF